MIAINKRQRQHYVPRFYLKFFSNDKKLIGTYSIKNDKITKKSPISRTAQKDYLYSKNKDDLLIEEELGIIEEKSSIILKNIIFNHKVPSSKDNPDDFVYLLLFILIQISRTKYLADNVNKSLEYFWDSYYKEILVNKSDLPEEIKKSLDQFTVRADVPNKIPLEMASGFIYFLSDLESSLFVSTGDFQFITSDVPVTKYNYIASKLNYHASACGLIHKGLMLFLPLSPKMVLMLYDKDCYTFPSEIKLSKFKDVKHINELILRNSYKSFFFNQDILDNQLNSLIKSFKKLGNIKLLQEKKFKEIDSNNEICQYSVPYINKLINIPRIKLTEESKNIDSPNHMGWIPRLNNPFIFNYFFSKSN